MRAIWLVGAVVAFAIGDPMTMANAGEIRLAEQFSMGCLQFMKRDKVIEKYAAKSAFSFR